MPARISNKTVKKVKTVKKAPAKASAKASSSPKGAAPDALLTAGKIALALKVPDAKVKKAIATLGLKPAAKKGVCNYYGPDAVPRIKKALAA